MYHYPFSHTQAAEPRDIPRQHSIAMIHGARMENAVSSDGVLCVENLEYV